MTLDELRRAYPDWAISRSGIGRYWAHRYGPVTWRQYQAGACTSVNADTLDQLDTLLDRQERIRRQHP